MTHNQIDETIDASKEAIISVKNLTKQFRLYRKPMDLIMELFFARRSPHIKTALENVSFEIKKGQIVGVIGRNGAGKSTLLKIIAGVMDHDDGEVIVQGRVSSILELGTGFHPEYTGRANIELGGTVIGMTAEEIASRMDSIIDFSELRKVIDDPFRTYSTGMQARLTFSTAISVEPDILIVDEALSVGDLLFQEKCFRKIKSMADAGVTVLFVTHSMAQIYELCDHALLFYQGQLIEQGSPREIGYSYERILAEERSKQGGEDSPSVYYHDTGIRDGDGLPATRIELFEIRDAEGNLVKHLIRGQDYRIIVRAYSEKNIDRLSISYRIERLTGLIVTGISTYDIGHLLSLNAQETKVFEFDFKCNLQNGPYVVGGGIAQYAVADAFTLLHIVRGGMEFEVSGVDKFQGVYTTGSQLISEKTIKNI